jgi:transcriptional regulator with PAS, ATPase and Fis domain
MEHDAAAADLKTPSCLNAEPELPRAAIEGLGEKYIKPPSELLAVSELFPAAYCEIGIDMVVRYANRNGLDTFGLSEEELRKGISIYSLFPFESHEGVRQHVVNILSGDCKNPVDMVMLKKDRTPLPVTIRSAPITRNSQVVGMRCWVVDHSEEARLNVRLTLSDQRFRKIFDKSKMPMAIFSASGTIVEPNDSFNSLFICSDPTAKRNVPSLFTIFPHIQEKMHHLADREYLNDEIRVGDMVLDLQITCLNPNSSSQLYLLQAYPSSLPNPIAAPIQESAQGSPAAAEGSEHAKALEEFITCNLEVRQKLAHLPGIAESNATVLIEGESGTGKELIARAIHRMSPRRDHPFIAINCSALPEQLLEAELFGYMAGAFTDAKKNTPGKFMIADKGTLLLDEIGDISRATQVKLLRALQEKSFFPLGAIKPVSADIRIVAATNRNMEQLVQKGDFREDLFYRIKVLRIHLPPLRDRRSDIPLLCRHFLAQFAVKYKTGALSISKEALQVLLNHNFPGNVRELQNILEHACIFCDSTMILPKHLPPELLTSQQPVPTESLQPSGKLRDLEHKVILDALNAVGGNKTKAAQLLGIHTTTLLRKLKKNHDSAGQ